MASTRFPRRASAIAPHGFLPGSAEFGRFLAIYDALVARFGVAADERFTAVLKRHHQGPAAAVQCRAYRAGPQDDARAVAQRSSRVHTGLPHPPADPGGGDCGSAHGGRRT
jgi:hypothetical protein